MGRELDQIMEKLIFNSAISFYRCFEVHYQSLHRIFWNSLKLFSYLMAKKRKKKLNATEKRT